MHCTERVCLSPQGHSEGQSAAAQKKAVQGSRLQDVLVEGIVPVQRESETTASPAAVSTHVTSRVRVPPPQGTLHAPQLPMLHSCTAHTPTLHVSEVLKFAELQRESPRVGLRTAPWSPTHFHSMARVEVTFKPEGMQLREQGPRKERGVKTSHGCELQALLAETAVSLAQKESETIELDTSRHVMVRVLVPPPHDTLQTPQEESILHP